MGGVPDGRRDHRQGVDSVRDPRAGARSPGVLRPGQMKPAAPRTWKPQETCPGAHICAIPGPSIWLHVAWVSPSGHSAHKQPPQYRGCRGWFGGGKTPSKVFLGEFSVRPADFSFQNIFYKRCPRKPGFLKHFRSFSSLRGEHYRYSVSLVFYSVSSSRSWGSA